MSKPFEQNVARWFHERYPEIDPKPGDRYAGELPAGETAEAICTHILEQAEAEPTPHTIEYEGEAESIPTLDIAGTSVGFVLVRRDGDAVEEPYEVSRSYATTLRNIIAGGEEEASEIALVMLYESGVLIETLDTTHSLFDADSELPLTEFQERILENEEPLDDPGLALVRSVKQRLTFPDDPLEDLEPLKTFCRIYDACVREDGDRLPGLIPDVGTYLAEDAFDDDWFDKTGRLEDLEDQADQILDRNNDHAERIANATRVTKDPKSELEAHYTDEFIDDVRSRSSWKEITRSEATTGEVERDTEGASDVDDSTDGPSSTKPAPDRDPEFEDIDIEQPNAHIYGSGAEAAGDRSIVAALTDGTFSATISYDADITDEPISFIDSTESDVDSWSRSGDEITISLSGLDTEAPHFYRLDVYVGHKTARGSPQNRFDIALVPKWFFDALDSSTFGVDPINEALTVRNDPTVKLTPSGTDDDARVEAIDVRDDRSIQLTDPVLLNPDPSPKTERVRCRVTLSDDTPVPINIDFLSEVEDPTRGEVQLPLSFAAIMSPDDWAEDDSLLINSAVVTDTSSAEFHSPSRGRIELPDADRSLLGIEEAIVAEETIAPRETDEIEVGVGVVEDESLDSISEELTAAYTDLFAHFQDRETIPSTDRWDQSTQEMVQAVLDSYLDAIDAIQAGDAPPAFDLYRRLGTIRSTSADIIWMTPFHPLMLAYGLRISRWRDDLTSEGLTDGFRFSRFRSLFNPVGLNPYRWSRRDSGKILSGHTLANNHLWAQYAPVEGPGSDTPDYIADVVADKLQAFATAFPLLFQLHEERDLDINLINMGDLGPVIEGLYDFFEFALDNPDLHVPQVNLQIYGQPSEGRTLERFFATDSADSPLRERLSNKARSDEILELLDKRVTYIRAGSTFNEEKQRPAHLTLFRGILDEQPGAANVESFPEATRMDGLLPRDQIKVDATGGEIISRSGAAFSLDDDSLLNRIGAAVNTLEASIRDNEFTTGRTLSKVVSTSNRASLPQIWDQSLWVLHVEPKVDLDFYIRSTAQSSSVSDDTLMIHYSDQYDAASPGFDVITTTDKRDPYLEALRTVLDETPGLDEIQPESVLTRLVAIDGELALDIQKAGQIQTKELLGLVGGLAVSAELLAQLLPSYEWIPISLNEFARHDRQYRTGEEGLLQYFGDGKASDDLCFVGLPRDSEADDLVMQLWVVETKGGTADVNKGVEQVKGAREKLGELFDPENDYADTEVLRSEFGDVVLRIARRLYHYGVLSEERLETLQQHEDRLTDGDYRLELLEDQKRRIGEVIRVQQNLALPDIDVKDGVRILYLPSNVLSLINSTDIGDNEIHSDLKIESLAFEDLDSEADREDSDQEEISVQGSQAAESGSSPNLEEIDGTSAIDGSASSTDQPSTEPEDSEAESLAISEESETSSEEVEGRPETTSLEEDSETVTHRTDQLTESDEGEDTVPESTSQEESSPDSAQDVPDESEKTEAADSDSGASTRQAKSALDATPDTEPEQNAVDSTNDVSGKETADYRWDASDFDALIESLEPSGEDQLSIDVSKLAADLKTQFESLGVDVYEPNPADVSIGPRKIGVNVRPKSGQKIEGVLNSLDSISIHMQASGTITGVPNPSEGAIRLEIPHGEPRNVHLREGLEETREALQEPLRFPLGVNTENEHLVLDLLEEHHALIGGATGSGKSNFLSAVICSLAATYSPSTVKLSLLDPKGIDFGRFEALPQVDTYLDDPNECVEYLQTLLDTELQNRRELLKQRGAASVEEHNRLAEGRDFDPIPYRVIIIDEFADLMMALSGDQDEFEEAIGRLAQIGRAMGYSILLATQRPDADIVSGSIKTNFNCRISFELPSNTDSRVILDQPGAEDLEGSGDMIALTSAGEEYHLQAYLLLPEDALTIRDRLTGS